MTNPGAKRVEYLDSIRGLAALFVLLSHTVGTFAWSPKLMAWMGFPFLRILVSGKEGVVMFFILSGYVLSRPYVPVAGAGGKVRKMYLPSFYVRRFARIWLPWFMVFLLSWFARVFLFWMPETTPPVTAWAHSFWQAPMTVGDFFSQCVFGLHDSTRMLLNQDWSLGVELKASLLMPLLIFLSRERFTLVLVILGVVNSLCLYTGVYYLTFILGVLLARYGDLCLPFLSRMGGAMKLFFLLVGLLLYQGLSFAVSLNNGFRTGWVISGIGCVMLLLFTKVSPGTQRFLHWKPFVLMGRVSYSIYLLQMVIILCLLPWFVWVINHCFLGHMLNEPTLMLATFAASIMATAGLALLTYRFVEVPSIDLGLKVATFLEGRFKRSK